MSIDLQKQRQFISSTRDRARDLINRTGIPKETKDLVLDLLTVIDYFDSVIQQGAGEAADARVLKKKLDLSKTETLGAQKQNDEIKAVLMLIIEEIKVISSEVGLILKHHEDGSGSALDALGAKRIRSSAQRMADLIIKSSQS